MSDDVNKSNSEDYELVDDSYGQMISYLENILTRQLENLKKYDLDGALALAEEANDLAESIRNSGVLGRQEYSDERGRIQILYKEIGLTIASERADVADRLKVIREGIKTLEAYSNIN